MASHCPLADKDDNRRMDERITFIGTFRIPDYPSWVEAITHMARFVEANVPRVEAFHAYANAEGTEGVVVYVHPDAESLDQHLAAAAQLIEDGSRMVQVTSIELLGPANAATVDRLRASGVPVSTKDLVRGFSRRA